MLHHEQTSEQPFKQTFNPSLHAEPIDTSDASVLAQVDPQVEDFLDRVFAKLVPVLPYEQRQARRAAMRAQIEQNVAAHTELGSTHEEALTLTLAQIQRENAVANNAVHPIQQTRLQQQSARTSTVIALGFFGLFYLLDQTRTAGHLWNHWFGPLYAEDGTTVLQNHAVAIFYRFELIVLPLISGLTTGLLSRARPVRGTLNALALLAIPAILWSGAMYGLSYADLLWANHWPEWVKYLFPNPAPAVSGIAFWAALGSLSAGAGGWLRRRLPRARAALKTVRKRTRRAPHRHWLGFQTH